MQKNYINSEAENLAANRNLLVRRASTTGAHILHPICQR